MNKTTFLLLIGLFSTHFATSQLQLGLKLGMHTFDLSSPTDIVTPDDQTIAFKDAKIGFHGGVFSKLQLRGVFIEPRIMLHSTKVEYTFNGDSGGVVDNVVSERFTNLDIPILVGLDVAIVDLYAGPVAHLNLNTASDLFAWDEYDERTDTADYGFLVGVGMDIGKIHIGVEYEGNFSKFGEHINIGGQEYNFDARPSRVLLNVGIRIF